MTRLVTAGPACMRGARGRPCCALGACSAGDLQVHFTMCSNPGTGKTARSSSGCWLASRQCLTGAHWLVGTHRCCRAQCRRAPRLGHTVWQMAMRAVTADHANPAVVGSMISVTSWMLVMGNLQGDRFTRGATDTSLLIASQEGVPWCRSPCGCWWILRETALPTTQGKG